MKTLNSRDLIGCTYTIPPKSLRQAVRQISKEGQKKHSAYYSYFTRNHTYVPDLPQSCWGAGADIQIYVGVDLSGWDASLTWYVHCKATCTVSLVITVHVPVVRVNYVGFWVALLHSYIMFPLILKPSTSVGRGKKKKREFSQAGSIKRIPLFDASTIADGVEKSRALWEGRRTVHKVLLNASSVKWCEKGNFIHQCACKLWTVDSQCSAQFEMWGSDSYSCS